MKLRDSVVYLKSPVWDVGGPGPETELNRSDEKKWKDFKKDGLLITDFRQISGPPRSTTSCTATTGFRRALVRLPSPSSGACFRTASPIGSVVFPPMLAKSRSTSSSRDSTGTRPWPAPTRRLSFLGTQLEHISTAGTMLALCWHYVGTMLALRWHYNDNAI